MINLRYIFSITLMMGILLVAGCKKKDDPGPSAEELQKTAMTKTWTITSARLGTESITDLSGLTLTIDGSLNYTTNSTSVSRQPNPWPTGGTFAFGENSDGTTNVNQVVRDGEVTMTISVSADGGSMTLDFTFDDDTQRGSNGKSEAVDGSWLFVFE